MSDDEHQNYEPESTATDEAAVATDVRKTRFSLRRKATPRDKAPREKKPRLKKPAAVNAPKPVYEPLSARIWIALLVVASAVITVLVLVLTTFF